MATRKKSEVAASAGPTPQENKAKAAFEEYKKRMDALSAGKAGINVGQPFPPPHPYPYGMPGWAFPPPPAMMPQPPVPQHSIPGYADMSGGSGKSLFESIGNMIRLGVDVVNAGLIGGLQIMEGFSGQGDYYCDSPWLDSPCHYPNDYHYGYCDCCCDPGEAHYGCNPSVHNC